MATPKVTNAFKLACLAAPVLHRAPAGLEPRPADGAGCSASRGQQTTDRRHTTHSPAPRVSLCLFALACALAGVSGGCRPTSTSSFGTPYGTTYHALSPISVKAATLTPANVSNVFESEMGRFSLSQFDAKGNVTYPVGNAGGEIASAQIVNDFLKYRTFPVRMVILRRDNAAPIAPAPGENPAPNAPTPAGKKSRLGDVEVIALTPQERDDPKYASLIQGAKEVFDGAVPVYFGIGVRIIANVSDIKGDVNLTNLPAVSASVSADNAHGTISVGAMGISGNSVGLLIQQPVALNDATVQTALQTVGAIKAGLAAVGNPTTQSAAGAPMFQLHPVVMGFETDLTDPHYVTGMQDFLYSHTYTLDIQPSSSNKDVLVVTVTMDENASGPTTRDTTGPATRIANGPVIVGPGDIQNMMTYSGLIDSAKSSSPAVQDQVANIVEQNLRDNAKTPVWESSTTRPANADQRLTELGNWVQKRSDELKASSQSQK